MAGHLLTKITIGALIGVYYFYLSDDSKQDEPTTVEHMKHLINIFFTNKMIKQYVSIIWEETDVCTK